MKKFFGNNKWMQIVAGTLMLVVGIIVVILATTNIGTLDSSLSILVAIALFIIGGLYIFISILLYPTDFFSSSLVYASICIALGVSLCVNRSSLGEFIIILFGVLFIAYGGIELLKGIMLIATKKKKAGLITSFFVIGAISLAAGILVICCKDVGNTFKMIIYIALGVIIAIFGLLNLGYGIYGLKGSRTSSPSETTAVVKTKKKKNHKKNDSKNEIQVIDNE